MTKIHGNQIQPYTLDTNLLVSGVVPSGSYTNSNITVSGGLIIAASNGVGGAGGYIAVTGDIYISGSVGQLGGTITNSSVSYSKFQAVSGNRILGRVSGVAGVVQELQLGDKLTLYSNGVLNATGLGGGTTTLYDQIGLQIINDSAIATGVKALKRIPYNCKITNWSILTDGTGTIQYDITKGIVDEYPSFISMVGTGTPIITDGMSNAISASNFNNWFATGLLADDLIRISVTNVVGEIHESTLFIKIESI